jgi:phage/plasmid-associated DNA primase
MKCPAKFNKQDFEKYWEEAASQTKKNLKIGLLHTWAKFDNSTEYERVMNLSLLRKVNQRIHASYKEGDLNHYDIAKILYECQQNKYVCDGGIWYEFVLEGEQIGTDGEVCKWRRNNNNNKGAPTSLEYYISEKIPIIIQKVLDSICNRTKDLAADDNKLAYLLLVKSNLKKVYKQLGVTAFNTGVVKAAERIFDRIGFINNLDTDAEIMGVGNGILKLGKEIEFINGFHPYNISLSTNVKYIPFNPYNPKTKALLIAIRNLFPDDEPDSFEFFMCYIASTLDGKVKESLLLMLVGAGSNGKTFIMNLVRETLGKYGVKMQLAFLTSRPNNSESATPALMSLRKARLAFYSETSNAEVLHLPKVKELTGQESLSGRDLFKGQENFQPVCHHIVTSNYDFEVNGNDHGTWRRLKKLKMKIKFCKKGVDKYNKNNPYERESNPDFGAKWQNDPEIKSSFLSILCHYYMILQHKYEGLVERVPHTRIKNETEEFRNTQDKINNFLSERLVKLPDATLRTKKNTGSDSDVSNGSDSDDVSDDSDDSDDVIIVDKAKTKSGTNKAKTKSGTNKAKTKSGTNKTKTKSGTNKAKTTSEVIENDDEKISLLVLAEKYSIWYGRLYNSNAKLNNQTTIGQLKNSKLISYIKIDKVMSYISGFRILDSDNDKLQKGEMSFADFTMDNGETTTESIEVNKESAEEYYDRICKEYTKTAAEKKKKAEKELERKNKAKLAEVKAGINKLSINRASSYKTSNKPQIVLNEYDKAGIKILKQTATTNCKEFAASSDDESDKDADDSDEDESDND